MPKSRCPTKWKMAHPSKAAARKHLNGLHSKGTARGQHVYQCPAGHWHVGSGVVHKRAKNQGFRKR